MHFASLLNLLGKTTQYGTEHDTATTLDGGRTFPAPAPAPGPRPGLHCYRLPTLSKPYLYMLVLVREDRITIQKIVVAIEGYDNRP